LVVTLPPLTEAVIKPAKREPAGTREMATAACQAARDLPRRTLHQQARQVPPLMA
jgi:hypothetical protein